MFSAAGLYGDVVEELDAAVGLFLDALERRGLAGSTFVWFSSDIGPWFESRSGFGRNRKASVGFGGGWRFPRIARWPGAARGRRGPGHGTDLFPTILALAGVEQPLDRAIDGASMLEDHATAPPASTPAPPSPPCAGTGGSCTGRIGSTSASSSPPAERRLGRRPRVAVADSPGPRPRGVVDAPDAHREVAETLAAEKQRRSLVAPKWFNFRGLARRISSLPAN